MCQLCGLPADHTDPKATLGAITLLSFCLTIVIGVWWFSTLKLLKTVKSAVTAPVKYLVSTDKLHKRLTFNKKCTSISARF